MTDQAFPPELPRGGWELQALPQARPGSSHIDYCLNSCTGSFNPCGVHPILILILQMTKLNFRKVTFTATWLTEGVGGMEDRPIDGTGKLIPFASPLHPRYLLVVPLNLPAGSIRNVCFPTTTQPFPGTDKSGLTISKKHMVPRTDLWIAI